MIQQTIFSFKIESTKIESTKERLTAHGGLALMAEFNHGIGLRELTDRYLPSPGSNRGFDPSVMVDSLVLMLRGGGRRLEDLRELKQEQGLMRLIGRDEIPEPDTVGDWLRRMGDPSRGQEGLKGLGEVRDKINGRILKRDGIKQYTLDADATEIVGEKADALFTYNGNKGYMPMLGFLYETAVCLYNEFQEGNVAPAFRQKEFYVQCNFNKEVKAEIGMERMPCGQSYANAVFFRIGGIAYNLFIGFKRLSCPESWMKQTIATFRWKLVQIAGRIVRHAGKTVLKLMIDLEKLELFKGIRHKSFELSLCPDG